MPRSAADGHSASNGGALGRAGTGFAVLWPIMSDRQWKRDLRRTITHMGRDLERRAYRALRGTADALRSLAPGVTHAGAELAMEMRRHIEAKVFRDRRAAHAA